MGVSDFFPCCPFGTAGQFWLPSSLFRLQDWHGQDIVLCAPSYCTNAASAIREAGVVLIRCKLSKQSEQVHGAAVDVPKNPSVP